jgi:acyl-CoA reductase-like NAD-dependent aldehyde dehydrogenase
MKQTAVEWLLEQLPTIDKYDPYYADIINQAKKMEKEQMKSACIRTEYEDKAWQKLMEKQFEQYYNETYKQQSVTDDTL